MRRSAVHARQRLVALAAAVALGAGSVVGGLVASAAEVTTERLGGADRYATAALVSASHFSPGVPVAFVATGSAFPDALAGGPAAATLGGPVLLVGRDAVPPATAAELDRLVPQRLVVLGGPGAVGDAVLEELRARTPGTVTRLSGPDRYATAAAISRATFAPGVTTAYVTVGTAFADALSAGAAAGARRVPVLLTAADRLPAATSDELARLRPSSITVLGGPVAVWPAVESALRGLTTGQVTRLAGADRYATSAAVSRDAFPAGATTVHLATGAAYPDALAGGPVAAAGPGPLLLVQPTCVPAPVRSELMRLSPGRTVLLGGAAAVGDAVGSGSPCSTASGSATASGGPATSYVIESADYASSAFGDPWDYANREDVHVGTPQMSDGGQVAGGQLSYVAGTQWPWVDPLPYLPGSTPLERDGPSAPIDTARYTHLSVRLYSSRASAAQVSWSTCDWSKSKACQGAMGVSVTAGWATYDWKIAPNESLTAPWTGRALQLRFLPTTHPGATVRLDWMRLHADSAPVRFELTPVAPGAELLWDSDADLANNEPDNPGWGRLGTVSGTSAEFPAASYPPGAYRLYTRTAGLTGPYTEPLTIMPRPRVVVESPGLAGGADFATTVRRDAWDFTSLSDVGRHENVCNARIAAGGVLAAENCGPEIDNPWFDLPIPSKIDGSTWHRLTVRLRYDGPFGLTGGPTGGAVARLIWYVDSTPGADQNVQDLVVYPGWQTITVDLATNPPAQVVDDTQVAPRVGWAGQRINRVRLDPNEDVSGRRWYVDSVRLSRDVRATGGRFEVALRETSGVPGQQATVYLDRDRAGADGVRVGQAPVRTAGQTVVQSAMPAALPNGTYWPYVVLDGPFGSVTTYARSPVQLTH